MFSDPNHDDVRVNAPGVLLGAGSSGRAQPYGLALRAVPSPDLLNHLGCQQYLQSACITAGALLLARSSQPRLSNLHRPDQKHIGRTRNTLAGY